MNRTALALKMLALLQVSGKLKKKEIAEKLEVKERYVVDLKNELITAGYNIVTESGVDGGYRLDDSMIISLPKLSDGEETALVELYREITTSNKPIGSLDALAALEKVCSDLHPDVSSPTLLNYSLIQREDTVDNEREFFTKLIYAIKNTRKIIARYDSFRGGSERERTIHPYTISKINEYYYLVGYEENSQMYKLFKLIRFVSLEMTDKTFRKDIAYDAKAYIDSLGGKAIGEEIRLKLRIAGPYMKTLQETPYGKDVVINKYEDYLIYETTLRGDFIINEFILKMGRYCKVIEPKELVDQMARTYELLSYSYIEDQSDTESFPYFQVIREDLKSNEREEAYVCIANHSLDEVSQWIDENKRESARKGIDSFYGFTYVFENELEMNTFLDLVKGRFREFGPFDWNEVTEKLSSIPSHMGYIRIIDRRQSYDHKADAFCVISKKLFDEKYSVEKDQTRAWAREDQFILLDSIETVEVWFRISKDAD